MATPDTAATKQAKSTKATADEVKTSDQSKAIADAIEQMRSATSAMYQAFGSVGNASSEVARLKVVEGKERAREVGQSAENEIAKKPLLYVGAAFAAGFVASRFLK